MKINRSNKNGSHYITMEKRTLFIMLVFVLLNLGVRAQSDTYNGVDKQTYRILSLKILEGFKKDKFSLISDFIEPNSIASAKEYFDSTIREGKEDGIQWNKIKFLRIITDNGIMTGSNPTKYDTIGVLNAIKEQKENDQYEVVVWVICSYEDDMFDIELGSFKEHNTAKLTDGEFYYSDEPIE